MRMQTGWININRKFHPNCKYFRFKLAKSLSMLKSKAVPIAHCSMLSRDSNSPPCSPAAESPPTLPLPRASASARISALVLPRAPLPRLPEQRGSVRSFLQRPHCRREQEQSGSHNRGEDRWEAVAPRLLRPRHGREGGSE